MVERNMFQSLHHQLRLKKSRSRDIAAWVCKAPSEARCNEVTAHGLHDRNRRGYTPGSNGSHRIGHDDIDVHTDQLGRKCGKPIQVCVGITKLDVQVSA
jgi:hypothetical protein